MSSNDILRVYICGAHSTGKTTIVNDLLAAVKLKPELDVARSVMQQLGLNRENIDYKLEPQNFAKLQKTVMKRLFDISSSNAQNNSDFICDRGIDPAVYTSMYLGQQALEELFKEEFVNHYIQYLRESVLFVVQPHVECISDDGIRMKPELNELLQFTDTMIQLLQNLNIPYHLISTVDRQHRVQQILDVIKHRKPALLNH